MYRIHRSLATTLGSIHHINKSIHTTATPHFEKRRQRFNLMHRVDLNAQKLLKQNQCEDSLLWTTKYFPVSLEDIPLWRKSQRDNFISMLDQAFVGPPWHPRIGVIEGPVGCGKTTLVKTVCRAKQIELVQFLPDEEYDKPLEDEFEQRQWRESPFISALIVFLERAQLVTKPGVRKLVLIDDVDISPEDRRQFIDVLDGYGSDSRRLFPLFWIPGPNDFRDRPHTCVTFNFPAASHSVLKRVVNRVSKGEGFSLTSEQFEEIIAGNPGDVRLAVNQLQLSRNFSTGGYQLLTFFQAVGEVLYNKQKRSAEDILMLSHCSPRMMVSALYENALDFFGDVEEYGDAADYFSEADMFMKDSWQSNDMGELAATTAMRGVMVANEHRVADLFRSLRQSKKSRLRIVPAEDSPFLCYPSRGMTAEQMDFVLFQDKTGDEYIKYRQMQQKTHQNQLVVTEQELIESLQAFDLDPIE